MLFSAYRRDDFADPDGFVMQLGVILCDFPEDVVNYVTSPKTGLQRRSKWPPSISEIVDACEAHQDFLKRLRTEKPAVLLRLPEPAKSPGYLANIFVPEGHPKYRMLVEWSSQGDPRLWMFGNSSDGRCGIWVNTSIWEATDSCSPVSSESARKGTK
jgi:hypothetical protein